MSQFEHPAPWLNRREQRIWDRDIKPETSRISAALKNASVDQEIIDRVVALINKLEEKIRFERAVRGWSEDCEGGAMNYDERMETTAGLQSMVTELTEQVRAYRWGNQ